MNDDLHATNGGIMNRLMQAPTRPPRSIAVVSPHLDDAVYSAWNWLSGAADVTVISVFAGVPPTGTPPAPYDDLTVSADPGERMAQRRLEDDAVCRSKGWRNIHLDFLDAPYRDGPIDVNLLDHALDDVLPRSVDLVLGPAAIGLHSDHIFARDSLLRVMSSSGTQALRLYADLPYAAYFGWASWVSGEGDDDYLDVDAFYGRALSSIDGWVIADRQVHALGDDQQADKLAAMQTYASQFPAMEGGPTRGLSHPERLPFEATWGVHR